MEGVKYAKLPKKFKLSKKYPVMWRVTGLAYRGLLFNIIWYPKWILRPICWIIKHKNRIFYPYGCKVKQCQRCAKVFYNRPTRERLPKVQSGEIGQLYGVRFITTNGSNKRQHKPT